MNHKIVDVLEVALKGVKDMSNVNVIVGSPITLGDAYIIPISKVKCSFVGGGMDQKMGKYKDATEYPFGGATGGSINIIPSSFLVYQNNNIKLLNADNDTHILEKLIDESAQAINKLVTRG